MAASSSSNNCFAPLATLKTPSGKFVLKSVASAGNNKPSAATGSNAIPIPYGNKRVLGRKVGTGLTLKGKPNFNHGTQRPALVSRPGLSAPRLASKILPQVKSYIPPSKGLFQHLFCIPLDGPISHIGPLPIPQVPAGPKDELQFVRFLFPHCC